jgi:ATP-binding cassette subfamily B multidrug efflux pump
MTGASPPGFGRPRTARRIWDQARRIPSYRWMLTFGTLSIITNLAGPLMLGRATDLIVARAALSRIHETLLWALLIYAVSGTCWILQSRHATTAAQAMGSWLRAAAGSKLGRLRMREFAGDGTSDLLARTTDDVDTVVQCLQATVSQLTNSLVLLLGLLSVVFWLSPALAIVSVGVVVLAVTVTSRLAVRAQPGFRRASTLAGRLHGQVEECYEQHAVIAAFGVRGEVAGTFRETNDALFEESRRGSFVSGAGQPAMHFVNNVGYVLVTVIGCLFALHGVVTVGTVQAFVQYSRQLSGPLNQITGLGSVVQSGFAAARRIFDLLDRPEENTAPRSPAPRPLVRGRVEFRSVVFGYSGGRRVLDEVTLDVRPGWTVAVVGRTGAGKTTLMNLLVGFESPDSGTVLIDGTDIAATPLDELRAIVGLVPQTTWVADGTVADNIGYGVANASRDAIREAARHARFDHVARSLPGGYDAVLGNETGLLSQGERQLLAVARAFLADPPILVLDEATSFVDALTEARIRAATRDLMVGRTTFVVAHRMSTVRAADLIVVLMDGRIVESGTHAELVALGGRYREQCTASTGLATASPPTSDIPTTPTTGGGHAPN